MAELVDALDSGSSRGNSVDVRVILAAKISSPSSFHEIPFRNSPALAFFLIIR
jgi:hypothetical protein